MRRILGVPRIEMLLSVLFQNRDHAKENCLTLLASASLSVVPLKIMTVIRKTRFITFVESTSNLKMAYSGAL